MRNLGMTVAIIALWTTPCAWPVRAAEPQIAKRSHYMVEMNCAPDDADAVTTTLRVALALRQDQSDVTLFIDLAAVPLADASTDRQPEKLRRETDRLFGKACSAGVRILVCPHCAQQQMGERLLREGVRLTTQKELESIRRQADQVFEYRDSAPDELETEQAAPDARLTYSLSYKPL